MSAAMERDADLLAALRRGDRHAVLEGLMERYRQKVMHLAVSIVRDRGAGRRPVPDHIREGLAGAAEVRRPRGLVDLAVHDRPQYLPHGDERERRLVPLEDFAEAADDDGDPDGRSAAARPARRPRGRPPPNTTSRKLLEQLPEPYRRVVVLFYLEDRSCEEVGELLSMPTGTVKALLHRGRKKLAALAGETETES